VQAQAPTWTLKRSCPVCEQGSCLVFVACPECARLAIQCDEDGSVFLDPHDLSAYPSANPETSACLGCGKQLVAAFPPATDARIREDGFTVADYE
jgi:hypothetical protein